MHFNWNFKNAVGIVRMTIGQRLQRNVDRALGRAARESRLAAHVAARAPAGDPAATLATIDEFARTQRWLMNVGPIKGTVLREAVQRYRPQRVLEIGAYCGYSAVLIGASITVWDGHLISIERSRRFAAVARGIVAHAGLADTVDLRIGTLSEHLDKLGEPFDLVFLDHWKDEYLADLRRLEKAGLVRAGSVIVADNVGFFAVPDYLDYVRNSGRYESRYFEGSVEYQPDLPDGVEVSVHRTSMPMR